MFSTVMASALLAGSPQTVFAEVNGVQTVMQTGTVKGQVVDATGEPVIGATQHTDCGRLPGIKGYVDFNIYNGSYYDLRRLTIGGQGDDEDDED